MPDGNPLIAAPQETTTAVTGIGIAESCVDVAHGVSNGDWVEAGLGVLGAGLEVLSMVIDPLGTLASYGVSWLIEHVRPLKEALDWFAGDPPVIRSFSQTWDNVAKEVDAVTRDFMTEANSGTSGWTGAAADAYRRQSAETADALAGAGALSSGISAGVMIMGEVVAFVREFVRDMVGELVGRLISWAIEEVATLGLATPLVVAQATAAISKVVNKVSDLCRKLVKTIGNVAPRIRKIIDKLDEIIAKLAKLMRRADGPGTPNAPTSAARHADDAPTVHGPDGTTAPSSTTTPSGTHTDTPTRSPDTTTSPDTTSPNGTGTSPATRNGDSPRADRGDGRVRDSVGDRKTDSREPGCPPGSGEPVDLATGQMFMTHFDLELPGMLPLILKRTHFSHYRAGRAFGRSWASTLDQRLDVESDGVYFVDDAAVRLVFPLPAPGGAAVLPEEGPRWRLALSADGTYTIHKPESGWTLAFGPGRLGTHPLATITNRCGHVIEFRYDDALAPTEVVHSGGYRVGVDTDAGRVVRLWLDDAQGGEITTSRYGYDARGDLVEIVNSSNRAFRLEYDDAARITKWIDRNDEWYRYFYDHRGRVVRTDGSGGAVTGTWDYDSAPQTTLYTNALGETTTYRLNDRRQVIEQIDPLGNSTRQEWSRLDQRLSRTDALGRTTRYTYDDDGDLVAVTRPDGTQTTAEFNELHLPVVVVEPDGAIWRYTYDANGNVTSSTNPVGLLTEYAYDAAGGLASVTDPTGQTRLVEADRAGLPTALTNSLGETTRYVRDAFGRISAVVDPAGNTVRQTWTIEGRLRTRTLPDGTSASWRHDPEGNQIEYVDPLGAVTRLERTHFGLPAVEIGPDGSRLAYRYDRELHLVSVTNEQGLDWRYEYDAAGNRVREIDFDGRLLEYEHDAAGQVVRRTNAAGQAVDYAYDLLGNVVERRFDGAAATFQYDELGRLLRAANADVELEIEHDRLGRVVRETVNGASVLSSYDALGRRVGRTTPSGAQSRWTYDTEGRPATLTAGGHAITFQHDTLGRETQRLLDNGTVLAQSWDANGRLARQTMSTAGGANPLQQRTYQYRADGLIESVADQLRGWQRYEFDARGRVTRARGAAQQQRYGYDEAGNIQRSDTLGERMDQPWSYVGTMLVETGNIRYRYDAEGRVVLRQRKRLSAKPDNWHFQWNAEGRLAGVTTPDGARWRYVYDPLGRRVAKQRLGDNGSGVAEQVTFHWDGTVIAEQETSGGTATTWDWEPDGYRPVTQLERARTAPREWVDRQFYSIVTDVIGTATELVDAAGSLAWHSESTLWGQALSRLTSTAFTPWRFQGQYFDRETGLHYNYARYYDPATGRYCSVDPLGLGGGANARTYAQNPVNWCDPLGLAVIWGKKKCLANTDNVQTMSGWSDRPPPPPGTTRVPPSEVLALQEEIGHPIRPNPFLDNGVPGQHYASHAERQAAILDPNAPVRVDIPQCSDCQDFFRRLAIHRGQTQVVTGPDGVRTYLPDGSVRFDPQ